MQIAGERLLRLSEVAAFTGRSPRTIRRWVRDGKIRTVGFGRSIWIGESDLLAALGIADEPFPPTISNPEKDAA